MEKRFLTKREEQAFRLCHHNFEGHIMEKAAELMGVTRPRIVQLLQSAKKKALQLFPILTKRQVEIRDYINEEGLGYKEIADKLGIVYKTVDAEVEVLKKKGVYLEKRKPTIRYQDYMDNQIKEKF